MSPSSSPGAPTGTPPVDHVSLLADEYPAGRAIAVALEAVAREVEPLAATFFRVDESGEIAASVVHGTNRPAAELARTVRWWKAELSGIDPLAPSSLAALGRRVAVARDVVGSRYSALERGRLLEAHRRIGAINDVRLPIWEEGRLVAGVTLWRALRSRPWSGAQLRALEALQPLIERAYLSALRAESGVSGGLPATLTRRQREVALLLASGATNAEVAQALYISPDTAKSHTRAVMGKLGVRSRREVVKRLMRSDAAVASPLLKAAHSSIQFEGAEPPGLVLSLVLDWAAERIDAAIGGCTLLSARREHVADAWGAVRAAGDPIDLRLARRVQRLLLPSADPLRILPPASDPGQWRAIPLDGAGAVGEWLGEPLASAGLAMPLVVALRVHGRVAGVVWLSRRANGADQLRESVRALRALHPLLEMACAPTLGGARPIATRADLERRGLTPSEVAVAWLAIGGDSNATIAGKLGVSRSTVKNHMNRVLAKCGVRHRAQLMALVAEELAEL